MCDTSILNFIFVPNLGRGGKILKRFYMDYLQSKMKAQSPRRQAESSCGGLYARRHLRRWGSHWGARGLKLHPNSSQSLIILIEALSKSQNWQDSHRFTRKQMFSGAGQTNHWKSLSRNCLFLIDFELYISNWGAFNGIWIIAALKAIKLEYKSLGNGGWPFACNETIYWVSSCWVPWFLVRWSDANSCCIDTIIRLRYYLSIDHLDMVVWWENKKRKKVQVEHPNYMTH